MSANIEVRSQGAPKTPPSWAAENRARALACARGKFQRGWLEGRWPVTGNLTGRGKRFAPKYRESIKNLVRRLDAAGVAYLVAGIGPRGGWADARCVLPKRDIERVAPSPVEPIAPPRAEAPLVWAWSGKPVSERHRVDTAATPRSNLPGVAETPPTVQETTPRAETAPLVWAWNGQPVTRK